MARAAYLIVALLLVSPAWAQEIRPGIGVDARGGAVIDPTKNVLDLVEAAIRRQDDLRQSSERLFQAKLDAAQQASELRYQHAQDIAKALAEKLESESRLRAEYDEKLRAAEAKRIDAIRLVDVNAVSEDRRRTGEQAVALATQVSQSAETLRSLVSTTKTSTDLSTNQITQALSQRITTLEQAGYQQAGKQTLSDPALLALNAKVDALVNSAGRDTGRSDVYGWIFGGIVGFGGLLFAFFTMQKTRVTRPR